MIEKKLAALFESDTNASDYNDKFGGYELNNLLKLPPWYPMLGEVWKRGGRVRYGYISDWAKCWDLLSQHYEEYKGARLVILGPV